MTPWRYALAVWAVALAYTVYGILTAPEMDEPEAAT